MTEAPPPENLPGLEIVPDAGRDIHAAIRADAIVNGEQPLIPTLVPDKGRDMGATLAAMDRMNGAPIAASIPEVPMPTLMPIVGGAARPETSNPVDEIEAEVARINALIPEAPAAPSAPEKPSEPAYGSAEYFAADHARRTAQAEKKSVLGRIKTGVQAVKSGMVKLGEGIENAEDQAAIASLAREKEKAADLARDSRNAAEIYSDHITAFGNALPATPPTEKVSKVEEPMVQGTARVPSVEIETPKTPPASSSVETRKSPRSPAREYWDNNIDDSESYEDKEMMEIREHAETLQIEKMKVDLARERIRVQELELALRQKEHALAVRMRKRRGPSSHSGGAMKIPEVA